MDYSTVINKRKNITRFNPASKISRYEIEEILSDAMKAPSSWNLQHWSFMVFHSNNSKQRLLPISHWQRQVVESSVTIAVLGDLQANKNAEKMYLPLLNEGLITHETKEKLIYQIEEAYKDKDHPRDNAFLNSSLAAMQLILSAQSRGYDTGVIGGFDSKKFSREFKVDKRYVPIMLINIGKATTKAHESKRYSIQDKAKFL